MATEQTSSWSSSEQKLLRSVADREESASIIVRYRTKPIQALVDTGSELTIAGLNLAKEHTEGGQAPRRGVLNRRQWTRKGPGAR